MVKIQIEKFNEVYIRIYCERNIAYEISSQFTFMVDGYQFNPKYLEKRWDGAIHLFNLRTRLLYHGLLSQLIEYAESRGYEIEYLSCFDEEPYSKQQALEFVSSLHNTLEPRDYQINALVHAVKTSRALFVSPTGSGKSFIQYLITCYYRTKTLIIVPTTGLVHQMQNDFVSYGMPDEFIHKIYSGESKETDKKVVITTWQSIFKMDEDWLSQFSLVLVDECHLAKSKSISGILEKMPNCKYRFGFTGSLDGMQTNELVIQGLLGRTKRVATTSELIDKNQLSDFRIRAIVLKYSDDECKMISSSKASYQTEMDYLVTNQARNNFITNLALSRTGNTLLMFQYVDKHGKTLYDMLREKDPDRPIYFVYGAVDGLERERIREEIEHLDNAIIIGSYGTLSTGANFRKLHNIIFASPSKSKVRNLQTIGRGLRLSSDKDIATLYDIADDLSWKKKNNYTLDHFMERISLYNSEKFNYEIKSVKLTQ